MTGFHLFFWQFWWFHEYFLAVNLETVLLVDFTPETAVFCAQFQWNSGGCNQFHGSFLQLVWNYYQFHLSLSKCDFTFGFLQKRVKICTWNLLIYEKNWSIFPWRSKLKIILWIFLIFAIVSFFFSQKNVFFARTQILTRYDVFLSFDISSQITTSTVTFPL